MGQASYDAQNPYKKYLDSLQKSAATKAAPGLAWATASTPSMSNALYANTAAQTGDGGLLTTYGTNGLPSNINTATGFNINSNGASGSILNGSYDIGSYTQGSGGPNGSSWTGSEMLGLADLGLKGLGAFTNWGTMQTAKDTLDFNKMNANRAYDADKLKYNNALARTEAINDFYGSKNVATKL